MYQSIPSISYQFASNLILVCNKSNVCMQQILCLNATNPIDVTYPIHVYNKSCSSPAPARFLLAYYSHAQSRANSNTFHTKVCNVFSIEEICCETRQGVLSWSYSDLFGACSIKATELLTNTTCSWSEATIEEEKED